MVLCYYKGLVNEPMNVEEKGERQKEFGRHCPLTYGRRQSRNGAVLVDHESCVFQFPQ